MVAASADLGPGIKRSIRIGTSGWSYDDWVGPFYPAGMKPGDYLPCYAQHFDVVEVDSTFYRAPSARCLGLGRLHAGAFRFRAQDTERHHAQDVAPRLRRRHGGVAEAGRRLFARAP
jgi:hypothetical protein